MIYSPWEKQPCLLSCCFVWLRERPRNPISKVLKTWIHSLFSYPVIWDSIIIIVTIASISHSIFIVVFLAGVGEVGAVILEDRICWVICARKLVDLSIGPIIRVRSTYFFTVIGGISNTNEVVIWPSIQICVFAADDSIASIPWFALTAEHGITVMAKVDASCVLVAVVCSISTRILWLADLVCQKKR